MNGKTIDGHSLQLEALESDRLSIACFLGETLEGDTGVRYITPRCMRPFAERK